MIPLVHDCNHANAVKVEALAKTSVIALIHKASQGTHFADPAYKVRRSLCKTHNLAWGAYHFNQSEPVAAQVEFFFQCAAPDDDTVMVLDYEDNPKGNMSFAQMLEFLELADAKLGRPVDIYSGNRIKETVAGASPDTRIFLAKRRLWLCQYGPVAKLFDKNGRVLPWNKYWLWQYTGDGVGPMPHSVAGLEAGADLSSFNGSAEELRAGWVKKPGPALVA